MVRYACLLALVFLGLAGSAPAGQYVEDFTTTAFKDTVNTTAWWDTTAGELKLSHAQRQ